MQDLKQYYDSVPYFSQAHPDFTPVRLQARMQLLGLGTAELERARVLEIGCSHGGNLFSFAIAHPQAQVVGIDISHAQITRARDLAERFGLKNVKFIEADLAAISADETAILGEFDFILAHGVFSWVAPDVQQAMLGLISSLLAPNGVAEVSLNVYPGWSSLGVVREFMLFASRNQSGAGAIAACDRELGFFADYLKFNIQNLSGSSKNIARQSQQLLASQVGFTRDLIAQGKDFYISHEFLEPSNKPMYFREFCDMLQGANLAYLVDASLADIFTQSTGIPRFDAHIRRHYASRAEREQLFDFMLNRSFRRAIIVKAEALGGAGAPEFEPRFSFENVSDLHLRALNKVQNVPEDALWLYELLMHAYPASLSAKDIVAKAPEQSESAALMAILSLLAHLACDILAVPTYKVAYEVGKSALGKQWRDYLAYFASTDDKFIAMADGLNLEVPFSAADAGVALMFDGLKSLEQIASLSGYALDDVAGIAKSLSEAGWLVETASKEGARAIS